MMRLLITFVFFCTVNTAVSQATVVSFDDTIRFCGARLHTTHHDGEMYVEDSLLRFEVFTGKFYYLDGQVAFRNDAKDITTYYPIYNDELSAYGEKGFVFFHAIGSTGDVQFIVCTKLKRIEVFHAMHNGKYTLRSTFE
jgi:hypothetical protein